jgi:DNA-binding CsgD family transcriptional regulator
MSRPRSDAGRMWRDLNLVTIRELLSLGKRVRMLLSNDALESPAGRCFATSAMELGASLHVGPRVDTPMILWEQLGAVHFLPHTGHMTLQVDDAACLEPLTDAWVGAGSPAQQVTSATVIRLLAAGHTDAVAARKLGISERQFRRYVSVLMQELDASSRFQAGIEAARSMQW